MNKISIKECRDYQQAERAVNEIFVGLGGADRFIKRGERVLIKPNLLAPKNPRGATTTHPAVVKAVCDIVTREGGVVTIADSPGGPFTKPLLAYTYKACGLSGIGYDLNYDTKVREVRYNGEAAKSFSIINPFFECDKIINIAKLKTHSMSFFSGGVKNLYGLVGGMAKTEYHLRYKDNFFSMLVDLCEFAAPALTIIDGVVGMEGNGPMNGSPREIGVIIGSDSAYLADYAAVKIIGADPNQVGTLKNAMGRGLCPENMDEFLADSDIEKFIISDFKYPDTNNMFRVKIPKFAGKLFEKVMLPYPKFDAQRCVLCMHCRDVCPAGAISKTDKLVLNKKKCIKCYCCQELCPHNAVYFKKSNP